MFDRYEIIDGSCMVDMIEHILTVNELDNQFTPTVLLQEYLEAIFINKTGKMSPLVDVLEGYVDDDLEAFDERLKDCAIRHTYRLRERLGNREYISGLKVSHNGDIIFSVEDEKVVDEEISRLADIHENQYQ